jgi:hypothetical protein
LSKIVAAHAAHDHQENKQGNDAGDHISPAGETIPTTTQIGLGINGFK